MLLSASWRLRKNPPETFRNIREVRKDVEGFKNPLNLSEHLGTIIEGFKKLEESFEIYYKFFN